MTLIWIAALLAVVVFGQDRSLTIVLLEDPILAGKPTQIVYAADGDDGPVSFSLWRKSGGNLVLVQVLANNVTGQFIWTPSTSLRNGDNYVLEISQGDDLSYSEVFAIQDGSSSGIISASQEPANTGVPSTALATSATSLKASRASTEGHTGSPHAATTTSSGPKIATHHGLSNGAAIGIGIGIAVVAICLLGIGAFACYRRRKREPKSAAVGQEPPSIVPQDTIAEAETQVRHEKDGGYVPGEMITKANTHEIDGKRGVVRHELVGS